MLIDHLKTRELLLVLDNCEHLITVCAEIVAAVLRACPQVTILATSREALNVEGEIVWQVSPLAVADPQVPQSAGELRHYESIQLFLTRATAALPAFALTEDTLASIATICFRLDGIPLAIELAAARVTALPVDQIATHLDDRFSLLTNGYRTAAARHQTLRALIDWSYDLLSEPERVLFRRLAVFVGGWQFDAMSNICKDGIVSAEAVLNLLTLLVAKSLVTAEASGRYRLLETIRQYAWEKLLAAGEQEVDWIQDRHLEFFLTMIEQAEREMKSPLLKSWLDRIDRDYANLRAAAAWAETCRDRTPDDERGLRLVAALSRYWNLRGHTSDARRWADRALAGTSSRTLARATAMRVAGTMAAWQDDIAVAQTLLYESATIFREHGAAGQSGLSDTVYALAATMHNENASAMALYNESLSLRREIGYTWGVAHSLLNLSYCYMDQGDVKQALALAEEGLRLARPLGDPRLLSLLTRACGQFKGRQGDIRTARRLLAESLRLYQDIDDRVGRCR